MPPRRPKRDSAGRYRKLYIRIWSDPQFRGLSRDDRLLAIYLLTGPQSNRCGFYLLSLAQAAEYFDMPLATSPQLALLDADEEAFPKRFYRVIGAWGWEYDPVARVLWIPSWWAENPPENRSVLSGALKDLLEVPRSDLFESFAANTAALPQDRNGQWRRVFDVGCARAREHVFGTCGHTSPHTSGAPVPVTGTVPITGTGTAVGTGTAAIVTATPGTALLEHYKSRWTRMYGSEPVINYPKDPATAKRLAEQLGLDRARQFIDRYFDDRSDQYAINAGHPLALFAGSINRLVAAERRRGGAGATADTVRKVVELHRGGRA